MYKESIKDQIWLDFRSLGLHNEWLESALLSFELFSIHKTGDPEL